MRSDDLCSTELSSRWCCLCMFHCPLFFYLNSVPTAKSNPAASQCGHVDIVFPLILESLRITNVSWQIYSSQSLWPKLCKYFHILQHKLLQCQTLPVTCNWGVLTSLTKLEQAMFTLLSLLQAHVGVCWSVPSLHAVTRHFCFPAVHMQSK